MGTHRLLAILRDLRGLIGRALQSVSAVETTPERALYQLVLLTSFSKTRRTIESILELASRGYWGDTSILVRVLFDQCVQVLYIAACPEERARLYAEHSYVARHERLQVLHRLGWIDQPTDEQRQQQAELEVQYERVRANYPHQHRWSGQSLRAMARHVGLSDHYDTIYWLLSNYEHSGVQATGQYSAIAQGGEGLIITEETTEDLSHPLLMAALTYAMLISEIVNQELRLQIDADLTAMRTQVETHGSRRMTQREAILVTLDDVIAWGSELFERSNELFRLLWLSRRKDRDRLEWITLMLGSRCLNGLRVIRRVEGQRCDDQTAVLARGFVESALDLQYLHCDTTRIVDKKEYTLTVEDKVKLFNEYRYIKHKHVGEYFPPSRQDDYERAVTFRVARIGGEHRSAWQGAGRKTLLSELSCAPLSDRERERWRRINHLWNQLSYVTHTNPYQQLYFHNVDHLFSRRVPQLRTGVREDNLLQIAVMGSIEVFLRWNLDIAPATSTDDIYERAIGFVRRLPEVEG